MTDKNPKNIQLCLISSQATPNLTPALDPRLKPDMCIFLVSSNMTTQAENLAEVINQATGATIRQVKIQDAFDIISVQNTVLDILSEYEHDNIVLNATGGTKPMSIAAYEAFRALGKDIFYIHPDIDQLNWLVPSDRGSLNLENRVKLRHFLKAHGVGIRDRGPEQVSVEAHAFASMLIAEYDRFAEALPTLNWYAARAQNSLRVTEEREHKDFLPLQELLSHLDSMGYLIHENAQITFSSEQARFFVNGGWIEGYVYKLLNSLKKSNSKIQDVAQSVETERNQKVRNESDVMILAENRLYLIECKTASLNTKHHSKTKGVTASDVLYKLDSLATKLGGFKASKMLVSYQSINKATQTRANELGIKIVHGKSLMVLSRQLQDWINK